MSLITEKKDVQNQVIDYLRSIGWKFLPNMDAFNLRSHDYKEAFLIPIVKEKLKELNKGIITDRNVDYVIRRIKLLPANIRGNEEFLKYLRNQKTVYVEIEKRERNVKLIDYENPEKNHFAFTEGFWFEDRDRREADMILFLNGVPIAIIENKSPVVKEAEEEAFDQIKFYTERIPELLKYTQFYVTCDAIRLHYGPTWNYEAKTFYRWKTKNKYKFERLTKTFFDKNEILRTLEDYITFLKIDEDIHKYLLVPHQRRAVKKIVRRVLDKEKYKGLIWHTQGAYKTLTMMVTAKSLREIVELQNPTILVVVDRVELEGQIRDNFIAFGFPNVRVAESKQDLRELLSSDYRGLIITLIHKFHGMPKGINSKSNIIVLIDEAHRSQEGDLGIYMRSALPNAKYFGFTGTPIDRGIIGQGTFSNFGYPPDEPYLDRYSIDESIEDKTTVPLYYTLTKVELHVDKDVLEEEFFKIVEEEGIASIEGVNEIIQRAEKLRAVLKAKERIETIAENIADHYRKFIEPSGFKAFIVAVDREACALYKDAIDKFLPEEYTKVVYTKHHKDGDLLRRYYINKDEEKPIRKVFKYPNEMPKILIVTQKLLTGYDAPILYAMYLDKPLKDHTLLQTIARVNRPYKGKTCGLVVDYVGVFTNLQRALTFDSKDIGKGLVDFNVLKEHFKDLMEKLMKILGYIDIEDEQNRVTRIIDYFFDEEKRNEFIKLFKEIERIYEILSPDEFLRDYMMNYKLLVQVYQIIYNAFNPEAERKRIRREILKKTEQLIREEVELRNITDSLPVYEINKDIANLIIADKVSERVKVINLRRSLLDHIEQNKDRQPYLLSIAEEIERILSQLRERQKSVESALNDLTKLAAQIVESQEEQEKSGLNKEEFSIFWILRSHGVNNPEEITETIYNVLDGNSEWRYNVKIERKVRRELYKNLIGSIFENKLVDLVNSLLKMHIILREGR